MIIKKKKFNLFFVLGSLQNIIKQKHQEVARPENYQPKSDHQKTRNCTTKIVS